MIRRTHATTSCVLKPLNALLVQTPLEALASTAAADIVAPTLLSLVLLEPWPLQEDTKHEMRDCGGQRGGRGSLWEDEWCLAAPGFLVAKNSDLLLSLSELWPPTRTGRLVKSAGSACYIRHTVVSPTSPPSANSWLSNDTLAHLGFHGYSGLFNKVGCSI